MVSEQHATSLSMGQTTSASAKKYMSRAHGRPCLSPQRGCYAEDSRERKAGTSIEEVQIAGHVHSWVAFRLSKYDEVCASHMHTD